ncbi:MAG TPA: riboflavin synthase [Steroidobacteraceae bacterium]|nr:riboflavin synthase [Steroidobacteraceae bacterium]
MFSGIVQDLGKVERRETRGGDVRLVIESARLTAAGMNIGDSVCVQGCCLTVTTLEGGSFGADVSRETLSVTTLGGLAVGARVNLEPALRAGEPLGGHLVSGHVDAVAHLAASRADARSQRLTFAVPASLIRYIAPKGSIAVDGVSLTVNEVEGATFGVNIIPHTQAVTTLGALTVGSAVNLEVDQIARYLERLMLAADSADRR